MKVIVSKYEVDDPYSYRLPTYELVDKKKWAIKYMGKRYTHDGEWIYEPIPSSRDEDFYKSTQFDFKEGMKIYRNLIIRLSINHQTTK